LQAGDIAIQYEARMAVSPEFRAFVVDLFARILPHVRARSMFGGVGIYASDLFFAIIDDDTVRLKVDDSNRAMFEARGMGPFRPFGPDGETMQYYELPGEILEDSDALHEWASAAIEVARAKRSAKRRRKR
jgi:DNA transformation protein